MKIGIRTPNIERTIKAKTTGRATRAVKASVNPLYSKKGMGVVNNPKKAVYNKVYNKTTISAIPKGTGESKNIDDYEYSKVVKKPSRIKHILNSKIFNVILIVIWLFNAIGIFLGSSVGLEKFKALTAVTLVLGLIKVVTSRLGGNRQCKMQ